MRVILALIILFGTPAVTLCSVITEAFFRPIPPGQTIDGSIIQQFSVNRVVECSMGCITSTDCTNHMFNSLTKICTLISTNPGGGNHNQLQSEMEEKIYYMDHSNKGCKNGGTYVHNYISFLCLCAPDYTGTYCEKILDECDSNPCQNGGTCLDGTSMYTCTCVDDFTGVHCETNIDDCDGTNPCQNGGTCQDGTNEYTCDCAAGYTGIDCVSEIDECESALCQNGGTCVDKINSYNCFCISGFTGPLCEVNIDDCPETNPCQNGGQCQDQVSSFSCSCLSGFTGAECETNIDDCETNPCQNNGTCIDGIDSFTCGCADGFTGVTCETNIDNYWVAHNNWTEVDPVLWYGFGSMLGLNNNGATLTAGHVGLSAISLLKVDSAWVDFGSSASSACFNMGHCPNGGAVSVWMKLNCVNQYDGILSSYSNEKTGFNVNCQSETTIRPRLITPDGLLYMIFSYPSGWFHLGLVSNPGSTELKAYLDGVLIDTDSGNALGPFTPGVGMLTVGRYYVDRNERYSNAELDDLAFWNVELNSDEIFLIYDQHK